MIFVDFLRRQQISQIFVKFQRIFFRNFAEFQSFLMIKFLFITTVGIQRIHFFRTDFQQFRIRILQNFGKISQISLKYENLDITLSEIIEILRNSGKNPLKFDEKLQNLLSPKKINKNCIEFCQKQCKGLEKSEKSGKVQRKKFRARKTLKNATVDAKIGVDTAENEPRKGSEKRIL